jgi:hypothetical protein
MHAYATDIDRKTVPIVLAVISIGITLFFLYLIQTLKINIPWWIDTPSVMGFYGILYALYDRVLWRQHLGGLRLSQIPEVSGVWAGELTSSYNNGTKIAIVFTIEQTWSRISIRTETETSTSSTTMAALNTDEYLDPGLKYEYLSEPGAFATPTMQIHRGTGHLRLSADGKMLTGDYYTGKGRQTFGTIELHLVSTSKVSRVEALSLLKASQP